MTVTKDMLLSELQNLLRMTSFEQTIATVRRTQAGSTAIAEELAANAGKSAERRQLLTAAVRQVGGVPDVVGQALGKVGALVQTQVNQVQTLQGALLGDLALEHSLRERTRYARTLAESLGYHQVLPVLDRLETAHTATIEWIEERLTEVGRTGTSALQATPLQSAVMATRRVVGAPFGVASAVVNRTSGFLNRSAGKAVTTVGAATDRATDAAKGAVGKGAEAAKDTAGEVAQDAQAAGEAVVDLTEKAADKATADGVEAFAGNAPVGEVGSLTDNSGAEADGSTPPFAGYDRLSGDRVIRHVSESQDLSDLQVLQAYEQAHKARKGVLDAVRARLSELGSPVGASS